MFGWWMYVLCKVNGAAVEDLQTVIGFVAAGTVVDRAGMVAVTALGAEGVQLGTRIVATVEGGKVFPKHAHQLILAADDTSTMSADGPTRPRVSKPEFAEAVLGTSKKRMQMGQAAALIHSIPTVQEVFDELFDGGPEHAQAVADGLRRFARGATSE